ncbi:hypothetical protein [Streptomyces cyaneofuscatus]|uniref:hypothetical protein n=1 Tax=Streptomyces cyaneofuscatus TaxID=66883 RepID=UPI002E105471|nr:hypothetical protein OG366_10455 [Streptomyces cyaneofuscatus]
MSVRGSLRHHRLIGMAVSLSATVALASTLSACSGDEPPKKAYTVPSSLCGISVGPALVKAALPGGNALSTATQKPNGGTIRCNLYVDSKLVLSLAQAWWSEGKTTAAVAPAYPGTKEGTMSEDERFIYSGKAGVGRTVPSCKVSRHPEQDLYVAVETRESGVDDPDAIEKLLTAYTKAVEESPACR